jgi:hypothetical protein
MAQRKYRTARGKTVDFGAMLANNETVPALGNMNVNARGDEILPDGTIIKTRDHVMKEYHNLNTMIPTESDIPEGTNLAIEDEFEPQEFEPFEETVEKPAGTNIGQLVTQKSEQTTSPSGSLASSVAGAKTVTQEVDKTGFEEIEGVKRI